MAKDQSAPGAETNDNAAAEAEAKAAADKAAAEAAEKAAAEAAEKAAADKAAAEAAKAEAKKPKKYSVVGRRTVISASGNKPITEFNSADELRGGEAALKALLKSKKVKENKED